MVIMKAYAKPSRFKELENGKERFERGICLREYSCFSSSGFQITEN
jgi:hypothetical protein